MAAFGKDNLVSQIKIFAVSSACLSLKYLFSFPVFLGFGESIVTEYFNESYVLRRLGHEQELKQELEKIS